MTVFTTETYNRIAHMNAVRASGKGGAGRAKPVTDAMRRERDAGLACHELALATVASIWDEFRSWSRSERNRPDLGQHDPETEIPF